MTLINKLKDIWFNLSDKIRFLIIGGFNAGVSFLIFSILCLILGESFYQISLALSWIISSVVASSLLIFFCMSNLSLISFIFHLRHFHLYLSSVWAVCVCVCVCVCMCMPVHIHVLNHVWLFGTPWIVAKLLCPWNFSARILEWVSISFSRGFTHPRTEIASPVSSALAGWFFYHWATWEAHACIYLCLCLDLVLEK